jgi:hypothetical protein
VNAGWPGAVPAPDPNGIGGVLHYLELWDDGSNQLLFPENHLDYPGPHTQQFSDLNHSEIGHGHAEVLNAMIEAARGFNVPVEKLPPEYPSL